MNPGIEGLYDYIDGLTDEQRDRIVREQNWRPRAMLYVDGARCLTGVVNNARAPEIPVWLPCRTDSGVPPYANPSFDRGTMDDVVRDIAVAQRFDELCDSHGTDHIVRLLKIHAGARMDALEPAPCT